MAGHGCLSGLGMGRQEVGLGMMVCLTGLGTGRRKVASESALRGEAGLYPISILLGVRACMIAALVFIDTVVMRGLGIGCKNNKANYPVGSGESGWWAVTHTLLRQQVRNRLLSPLTLVSLTLTPPLTPTITLPLFLSLSPPFSSQSLPTSHSLPSLHIPPGFNTLRPSKQASPASITNQDQHNGHDATSPQHGNSLSLSPVRLPARILKPRSQSPSTPQVSE